MSETNVRVRRWRTKDIPALVECLGAAYREEFEQIVKCFGDTANEYPCRFLVLPDEIGTVRPLVECRTDLYDVRAAVKLEVVHVE
ncbi:MAG TPA: hypothetical protein VD788_08400 [Candidatus Polarisedimenticolaceae bacterium]|nr:hypothetical protein [Candidatus Polarisedimenticolaceae bacterium]